MLLPHRIIRIGHVMAWHCHGASLIVACRWLVLRLVALAFLGCSDAQWWAFLLLCIFVGRFFTPPICFHREGAGYKELGLHGSVGDPLCVLTGRRGVGGVGVAGLLVVKGKGIRVACSNMYPFTFYCR